MKNKTMKTEEELKGLQRLFDRCIQEAIMLGRKYMEYPYGTDEQPTPEEWQLALVLFQNELR